MALTEKEIEDYLRALADPFAYISGHIPDVVVLDEKPFKLKEFIKDQKRTKTYKERDLSAISWALKGLDALIGTEKETLGSGRISRSEADELIKRTKGLLRAHVLLSEMLEGEDLEPIDADREVELEDIRRWIDYSKKIG